MSEAPQPGDEVLDAMADLMDRWAAQTPPPDLHGVWERVARSLDEAASREEPDLRSYE